MFTGLAARFRCLSRGEALPSDFSRHGSTRFRQGVAQDASPMSACLGVARFRVSLFTASVPEVPQHVQAAARLHSLFAFTTFKFRKRRTGGFEGTPEITFDFSRELFAESREFSSDFFALQCAPPQHVYASPPGSRRFARRFTDCASRFRASAPEVPQHVQAAAISCFVCPHRRIFEF